MAWQFSIGNLVQRAVTAPAAVSPAVSDTLLPLTNLATGYPDQEASFEWRSDGHYKVDIDLNVLRATSSRTDAPSGWRDYLLYLAGTPGLGSNAPDWGSYGSRTALRLYKPMFQEIEVLPGEDWKLSMSIYEPTASTATGIQVRVIDTWSGLGWNGSAWTDGGILDSQSTEDTWKEIAEEITADPNRSVRSTYLVVVEPIAATYSATTYVYASANGGSGSPALYGKVDFIALIGHNIPSEATVSCDGFSFSTIDPITATKSDTATFYQVWRLDIQMPAGNQPRPKIGELWMGRLQTFTRGPDPGIDINEGDINQIRVSAAGGRQEVLSDMRIPARSIGMKVRTFTDAAFTQYRDQLTRGTRFGAEPLLLVPPLELEGIALPVHGRVGPVTGYKNAEAGWREFTVNLMESPFSGS